MAIQNYKLETYNTLGLQNEIKANEIVVGYAGLLKFYLRIIGADDCEYNILTKGHKDGILTPDTDAKGLVGAISYETNYDYSFQIEIISFGSGSEIKLEIKTN